jgi:heme oxygenase (mycobilin-producing)
MKEDVITERSAEPVVLINVFSVPKGQEEEFLQRWGKHAEALIHEPGFIRTKLHRSLDPEAQFNFINVAHWESVEAFRKAIGRPEYQQLGRLTQFGSTAGLYNVHIEY